VYSPVSAFHRNDLRAKLDPKEMILFDRDRRCHDMRDARDDKLERDSREGLVIATIERRRDEKQ
jgi:hypothetical protein